MTKKPKTPIDITVADKTQLVILNCDICGDAYYDIKSEVGTTNFNCCSLECERESWQRERPND